MKLRPLPSVIAACLVASGLLVAGPAVAAPSAPGIGALDTSTPGKVKGTVTSDQPFVFVALDSGNGAPLVATKVTMLLSHAFQLDTWGFGPGTVVVATACPTGTYDPDTCSPAATQAFTPSDLVPSVTWFTDDHIGPDDPQPSITVSDPGGGGLIVAKQENGGGGVYGVHVVPPGAPENLPVADLVNGEIRLYRCNADQSQCTPFTPDQTHPLSVLQHLNVQVTGDIAPVNSTTNSSFRLQILDPSTWSPVTGTATVTWHLTHVNGGASAGSEHVTSATATGADGITAPITITADGVPDDDYNVVGTLDLETAAFGTFHVSFVPSPVLIDVHAPTPTIKGSHPTIYPYVNTSSRPGKLVWFISGSGFSDISRGEIHTANDTYVRQVGFFTGSEHWSVEFNGLGATNKVLPAGTYHLVLWDKAGNRIPTEGTVKVDTRHLVTKTWKHTISAAGSLVDKYVGKCATLRKPSLRGWYNSLGYYSNTKCESQSSKYSLVSTIHGMYLPKVSDGYVSVGVDFYGGPAKSRPGSQGVMRYLSAAGNWTEGDTTGTGFGDHAGRQRAAKGMIGTDRSFFWGFYTAYGHRYDVKTFTVVLRYKTLA